MNVKILAPSADPYLLNELEMASTKCHDNPSLGAPMEEFDDTIHASLVQILSFVRSIWEEIGIEVPLAKRDPFDTTTNNKRDECIPLHRTRY